MSSAQNDLNTFPLNLGRLKDRAERWVVDNPGVPIERITLYHYASPYPKITPRKSPVKFCVVFGIKDEKPRIYETYQAILDIGVNNIPERAWLKNEPLPEYDPKTGIPKRRPLSDIEREEARTNREKCEVWLAEKGNSALKYDPDSPSGNDDAKPIDSLLECFHTVRNQDSFLSLMDADFSDVYPCKPGEHFKDEWMFLTGLTAEWNTGVRSKEACWVLYEKESMPDEKVGNTIVRKAGALAVANAVKIDCPRATLKEAARIVNARLATVEAFDKDGKLLLRGYSEKYMMKIIKPVGFKPGKPGKKPKK